MTDYLIGTGGWAYFNAPNKSSLEAYSHVFNFVEVNNTFYQFPSVRAVEGWRRAVPDNFTFSVRCHQNLTHEIGLKPANEAYEIFYQAKTYCDKLLSPYLVLETPDRYVINKENIKDAKDFFSTLNLSGVRLIWEHRAPITQLVTNLMRDFDIIQCVDLSKENAAYSSDVTYSRLFGKGQHNIYQFTDEELTDIDQRAQDSGSKTVILAYHGSRMHTDAIRFQQFKKNGTFPSITPFIGAESAKAVLAEDAKFPASRMELAIDQGWKVIDLTADKRVHLSEALSKIPDKTYSNLNEVIVELRAVL